MRPLAILVTALLAPAIPTAAPAAGGGWPLDCADASARCADVADSDDTFGHYAGHDEPALAFYSSRPDSGNRVRWRVTLPVEPAAVPPAATRTFQLTPAFWFGMALCDTQSSPLQVSTCTAASDANITDLAHHPGAAFLELQFYPPGWIPLPFGPSCDASRWCAAVAVFSLARDPVGDRNLNKACVKRLHGGVESINLAFVTKDGRPHAPPDPLNGRADTTGTVNPVTDLLMNQGDELVVTITDSAGGAHVQIDDLTTHETGAMTASAANGFAQVAFAPKPSRDCRVIPYDFHPMYSTSSDRTRLSWTAHAMNVSFAAEIGHFQYCSRVTPRTRRCVGAERPGVRADRDNKRCVASPPAPLVAGCLDANTGFDGPSYQLDWPDGDAVTHPTPFVVQSPLTGPDWADGYERVAFETNLPILEALRGRKKLTRASRKYCDTLSGARCSLIPRTDRGTPAAFYPFFSLHAADGACEWAIGDTMPGFTTSDFGKNAQFAPPALVPHLFKGFRIVNEALIFRGTINAPCTPSP